MPYKPCIQQAQFAQQATSIARGLDVRLFIGPAIALAVQHVSLELSQQILPPLMGLAAPVLEQRQEVQGKQPLKRALFPEPQAHAGVNGSPHQADLAAIWHGRAHIEISRHISSSNATQLAALMRALPLPQASQALAGASNGSAVQPAVPLSHSSVLLAHLQKALPAPQQLPGAQQQASAAASSAAGARSELQTHSSSAEAGHSSSGSGQAGATQHSLGMAVAAGESPEASALEEAYRGCRKHLKQLQAGHLAALLRFWLQRGPSPIPSVASSRPELRGALRLRALQDGIAASRRHAGKARQPAEVSYTPAHHALCSRLTTHLSTLNCVGRGFSCPASIESDMACHAVWLITFPNKLWVMHRQVWLERCRIWRVWCSSFSRRSSLRPCSCASKAAQP